MLQRSVRILFKTVVPLLLGAYLVWYFFDSMQPNTKAAFYKAVKEANYGWIFLSLLLSLFALFSRAYRWKYLLEPLGYKTRFWHRFHALMIGYVMNLTIPRAGEASRAAMLYRSDEVPFSKSFGTIVAERVFDVLLLFSVVLITAAMATDDFWQLKRQIELSFPHTEQTNVWMFWLKTGFALLVLATVGALLLVASLRAKVVGFAKGLVQGGLSIFRTKNPWAFIGHSLFIWIMYLTYFGICFFSLEETSDLPVEGMLLAFVAGSVGISLTNGGLGIFPLVVGLVVDYFLQVKYGKKVEGVGAALGMIIWSSQTALVIILGLLSFVLLPKNYSNEHVKVSADTPEDTTGQ